LKKYGKLKPTKKLDNINLLPNFKQVYGESLKDAWVRINKMNNQSLNVYENDKLHLYFHYGLSPWYKNALDFASRGSFVLSSPEENFTVIKNPFGNKGQENEELEDMSTVLAYLKKRFENCAKRLLDKWNLDHLELFSKYVISNCIKELKKKDNKIVRAEEEIQCLGQVLELAASFQDTPKEKVKNYVFKNLENIKNQGNK
jgi:hypothetical protein